MNILGIETSCDETAAALVADGRRLLASCVRTQVELHAAFGGVVPEIASRAHTEAISHCTNMALSDAGITLSTVDAVAVTNRPGLVGALLVGVSFAKALALARGLPLVGVNHLRGHIAAAYLDYPALKPPFFALVLSGGHTFLCEVQSETQFKRIGATRDDAAGEAFDKAARVLGLGYPGGGALQALADSYTGEDLFPLPPPILEDAPFDFSFSGIKTAVVNVAHRAEQQEKALDRAKLAASFSRAVCAGVADRLEHLFAAHPVEKLVLAGGVAANGAIRACVQASCLKHGAAFYPVSPALCGDNAAMIAAQGFYELRAQNTADLSLNAVARADLE